MDSLEILGYSFFAKFMSCKYKKGGFGPVEAMKVEVVDVIDAMTISKELGIDCSDITIMVNEVEDPFKGD